MKYLKKYKFINHLYEDKKINWDDWDEDEEYVEKFDTSKIIVFEEDIQAIDIAKKLKKMGYNVYNYSDIVANIDNYLWSAFHYNGFYKHWVRGHKRKPELGHQSPISYEDFMKEKIQESIHQSKYKMKTIVDDLLTKHPGGRDYFNTIDSIVKLTKNIDLIQDVFDEITKENKNFNLILTGGFGDWVLSKIKKQELKVPKNLVLVNGSIRGSNNKLNKITKGKEVDIIYKRNDIENQEFILFDDSYYSGSTKKAIERYLKKYNSTIVKTYVLYDGNDDEQKDRKSLYRYYDYHKGTEMNVEKLLDYLHDNNENLPTDYIENLILRGQVKTIRQINGLLNNLRNKFNKEKIDIHDFTRREELKYENKKIDWQDFDYEEESQEQKDCKHIWVKKVEGGRLAPPIYYKECKKCGKKVRLSGGYLT
jgi:hypothetical protein